MKAITVRPGTPGARVEDVPAPPPGDGSILVQGLVIGVCGTDAEIVGGRYGTAPPGRERLVLGHESLGRVVETDGDGWSTGDLVVGIVRRPDPEPCPCCAQGRWDLCRNGRYTERGIKERDGYGSERWRVEPEFCIRLDPALEAVGVLVEPTSIVAKAWAGIDALTERACTRPRRVAVTGAGPIGLLAALLARRRGLETHVLDIVSGGPKPDLVAALGATYHARPLGELGLEPDVVVEATGAGDVVIEAIGATAPDGIVCLTGVSAEGRRIPVDAGALNRELVLQNDIVLGSVNAAREHYELAAEALADADRAWLEGLITRRVPLDRVAAALERRDGDVKTVIDLGG